jgi:hypothetical protein
MRKLLLLASARTVLFFVSGVIAPAGLGYRCFTKPITEAECYITIVPSIMNTHIDIAVFCMAIELLPMKGIAHIEPQGTLFFMISFWAPSAIKYIGSLMVSCCILLPW